MAKIQKNKWLSDTHTAPLMASNCAWGGGYRHTGRGTNLKSKTALKSGFTKLDESLTDKGW